MKEARKLRSEFLQVLRSRRSGEVPMLVEPAKPVANPLFQEANPPSFSEALISAWKQGDTMPFIFDTVWDLIKLADYLTQREDIDPTRIEITDESLGGMRAWFAAAADTRYAVVVPIIGVQGFRSAIDNDKWKARVSTIRPVFEGAEDPLCPVAGLEVPKSKACKAYADAHAVDNFKLVAQPGIRHRMTPLMVTEASDWFDQFLKQ